MYICIYVYIIFKAIYLLGFYIFGRNTSKWVRDDLPLELLTSKAEATDR